MKIKDPDHEYLAKHFTALIRRYGGKWIVVVKGRKFAIISKGKVGAAVKKARKQYPGEVPLISAIPTREQLQCILKS